MRFKPQTIQESGGLAPFLDARKDKHNGLGYKEFTTFHRSNVNITNLARAFKVSRPTAVKWLAIYEEEKGSESKPVAKQ